MAHNISIEATANALLLHMVQFGPKINQNLKQTLEFERDLSFVACENTWAEPNVVVTSPLQPYQSAFTPNNTETFDVVENQLQHGKIDLEFTHEQLKEFYEAWKCNWFQLGRNPLEWSYPRYIIDMHFMPEFFQDLNLASWNGVRVEPTPGTAGTATQSFDGFAKKITDAEADGLIVPAAMGTVPVDSTIIEYVRDWIRMLPIAYRNKPGKIRMSTTNASYYAEAYQRTYQFNSQISNNADTPYLKVDHFNKVIVPMDCMEGSNRMIFYPDTTDNMVIGTRINENVYPELRFEPFERKLKVMGEFSRFFGFRHWGHQFVTDQV
jgi:hypothetical protein